MKKAIVFFAAFVVAFAVSAVDYTPVTTQDSFVQSAAITATAQVLQTNTFTQAFSAAPLVVCTYTEDPGDVKPIFVTSVTATSFICSITADKNFSYVAVGASD